MGFPVGTDDADVSKHEGFEYRHAMRMSNGEINRLGDRLRALSVVAPDDLDLLQELRREYQTALHVAQARALADELVDTAGDLAESEPPPLTFLG